MNGDRLCVWGCAERRASRLGPNYQWGFEIALAHWDCGFSIEGTDGASAQPAGQCSKSCASADFLLRSGFFSSARFIHRSNVREIGRALEGKEEERPLNGAERVKASEEKRRSRRPSTSYRIAADWIHSNGNWRASCVRQPWAGESSQLIKSPFPHFARTN